MREAAQYSFLFTDASLGPNTGALYKSRPGQHQEQRTLQMNSPLGRKPNSLTNRYFCLETQLSHLTLDSLAALLITMNNTSWIAKSCLPAYSVHAKVTF